MMLYQKTILFISFMLLVSFNNKVTTVLLLASYIKGGKI